MATNKKIVLPDLIEAELIATNPGINAEKLEELKAKVAEQLAINKKREAELNDISQPKLRLTTAFVSSYIGTYVFPGTSAGTLNNGTNLQGPPNGMYADFYTAYPPAKSIFAIVTMTVSLNRAVDIYIYAKKGVNAGPANYVKVYYSPDNMANWHLVGQVLVTTANNAASPGKYLMGSAPPFTHLMVGTASMDSTTSPSHILVDTMVMEY
ncbi:MAG: hypothetical protein LBC12_02800 [Nitrososphaerota archaeon]|jgi:hypothetical protein|nr:hypothetical protein [Nitrososphaerota archaeon]